MRKRVLEDGELQTVAKFDVREVDFGATNFTGADAQPHIVLWASWPGEVAIAIHGGGNVVDVTLSRIQAKLLAAAIEIALSCGERDHTDS